MRRWQRYWLEGLAAGCLLVAALGYLQGAYGQHAIEDTLEHQIGHDLYHAQYRTWMSNSGFNCCNDQDCSPLADDHIKEDGDYTKVRVDQPNGTFTWCPVLAEHLLRVGKSPDWSRAHACILPPLAGRSPCERLKCFVDRART